MSLLLLMLLIEAKLSLNVSRIAFHVAQLESSLFLISNRISAGNSYEHEQELRAHPSGMPENELDDSGYFERLGAKTESFLENFFTAWGTYCASNPWKVLLMGESSGSSCDCRN